jgi:hypothetical protein
MDGRREVIALLLAENLALNQSSPQYVGLKLWAEKFFEAAIAFCLPQPFGRRKSVLLM